jgi:hypothetical protein
MSDSESNAPNKCKKLKEDDKIKIIKSRKSEYDHSDLVEEAIKMFKKSQCEEWKNRLVELFWDLHNKKCCCHRHSQNFPAHPWDVNALKFLSTKTYPEVLEIQLECSSNIRYLARRIVRVLNRNRNF